MNMAKKVGTLIKEARTAAGLTQEQLAKKVAGVSASDISKAERGEKELTQEQLKAVAKATGVTQKSLLDAAKGAGASSSSSSSSSKSGSSMKLTAAEKKLVEAYRKADKDTKEKVLKLLGESKSDGDSPLDSLLNSDVVGNLLSSALGAITGKK